MAQKVVFITTVGTGTFRVPSDFRSLVSVEAIGGGAAGSTTVGGTGGGGGGGGAYARSTTMSLIAGQTTYYSLGVAAQSWFNPTTNAAPTANSSSGTNGILAGAGTIGVSGANGAGGAGGTVAASTGDLRYAGGNGGIGGPGPTSWGGAGGGAGGPGGAGGTGGNAFSTAPNGTNPGGGSGATLTVAGTAGQNGQSGGVHGNGGASAGQTAGTAGVGTAQGGAGSNGGGGGGGGNGTTPSGGAGGAGTFWLSSTGVTAGSGGGAGGSNALGGLYGGGSAAGQTTGTQGIIVFTYRTEKTVFITTVGTGTYIVPSDFQSLVSVEAIGGGGAGGSATTNGGGGGGAYAKTTSATGLTSGATAYYQVGTGGASSGAAGSDSWFNAASNAAPTLSTQGVLAKAGSGGGSTGGAGGASASCVPTVGAFSGGTGGNSVSSIAAGGGGAAGPGGVGGNGTAANASGGKGGGGGGASLTTAGYNAGAAGVNGATGGNGGYYTTNAITVIGANEGHAASNPTITVPSGTQNGDLMVLTIRSGSTITTPSGWTVGTAYANGLATYYKTASSEPANYTVTTAGAASGYILTVRNARFDVSGSVSPSTASPVVSPGITLTENNSLLIDFVASTTTSVTFTTPSGFTSLGSNTVDMSSSLFIKSEVNSGATGDVSSAISSSTGRGILVGLKSASGGAGGISPNGSGTAGTAGIGGGGGGAVGSGIGGAGGTGSYWTQTSNSATAGSGGGGGGGDGVGGLYGGGGSGSAAAGAQGIIVFTYEPKAKTEFLSLEGDLEKLFVTDYAMIDQYAATGSLWTWGRNADGQLGDNLTPSKSSPIQTVSAGTNWKLVSSMATMTAAIKTDGTLWLWGNNSFGQLGNNAIIDRSSPVQTVSAGTNWKQVAGGTSYTAAIKTDGTLWTWGGNSSGQLGDNTITTKSSPIQTIAGGTNWKQVTCGFQSIAAIKTDGTLWTWGFNGYGQLGDNSVTSRSSPVQTVAGGTNWKQVAGGRNHTASIKTDGTLWLWGHNTYGQLGDNSITHRSSPVQTISGGTNWKQVTCGFHTAAIKTDGTLWTWGRGVLGEMGDNTVTSKSSPIQTVAGGTNWKLVAGGRYHTTAIKTDGTLWLWGHNAYGQLGDNIKTHRSSPIQTVSGGTNWKSVSSGQYHTAAIFFYEADKLYPPS